MMLFKRQRRWWLLLVCLQTQCIHSGHLKESLLESDRLIEFHKRYSWPPTTFSPNTTGWRELYERRFSQVEHLGELFERYQAWHVVTNAAYGLPSFTEHGWGLTRAPDRMMGYLRRGIRSAIRNGLENLPLEPPTDVVTGDTPWFINKPTLANYVLKEMQPMVEAWAGIELTPYVAYGFRLYRNQSRLVMHWDECDTHVLSAIVHIDSSEDSEPWPLYIEDYQGITNEVILKSGDVLFYESNKCLHGRPIPFNGSYYSSVFVHFMPADEQWKSTDHILEGHYAIPSHWDQQATTEPVYPTLKMQGAALTEPGCDYGWCGLNNTKKWSLPAEEGYVLTTGNHRYPLFNKSVVDDEL